jgi:hypothetical protein
VKPSVYLETTIISYLAARPSRDSLTAAKQRMTDDWWTNHRARFDLYVSEAVLDEAKDGDPGAAARRIALVQGVELLIVTQDHGLLASRLMREAALPERASLDAVHIAVAAMHNIDFLVTWNCKHIASPVFRPRIESVCRNAGVKPPEIATPIAMLGI